MTLPQAPGSWRKSSYSAQETNCVEVAFVDNATAVRDSKNPSGPVLVFQPAAVSAFVSAAKDDKLH